MQGWTWRFFLLGLGKARNLWGRAAKVRFVTKGGTGGIVTLLPAVQNFCKNYILA